MQWHELWSSLMVWTGRFVLGYMIVVLCFYTFFMIVSAIQLRRYYRLNDSAAYEELLEVSYAKPISILVPAYNEEKGIIGSVRSLLNIEYPEFEVIVINDGSKDRTVEVMLEQFQMVPIPRNISKKLDSMPVRAVYQSKLYDNLFLLDKENGGKADALNSGINYSSYPYFCSLDGDSVLERGAFLRVMKPILDSDDEVIASGGSIRIANGCTIESGEIVSIGLSRNPYAVMQVIEYLRAFLLGRVGLSKHNLLLIVSGAFGVFSKHWVVEAGGYRTNTVGEDMELVVRLHRMNQERKLNKRIMYIPDPVCWTEAPESPKYLRRQRNRWHRGLFESLMQHRSMIGNPKYGSVGLVSMPYFLFIELLGPVVEAIGYVVMVATALSGSVYWSFTLLLMVVTFLYGSIFSMGAVLLEEWSLKKYPRVKDLFRLFFYALTESLWYRPLTVLWRCEGLVQWVIGKRGWGEMQRKGLSNMTEEKSDEPKKRGSKRRWVVVTTAVATAVASIMIVFYWKEQQDHPPGTAGNTETVQIGDITIPSRAGADYLQVYRDGEWQDIFLKGVNMGIAKPGHFPGETAITKEEYARWIQQIGEMNANVLRIYTIHPPGFYEALLEYNNQAEQPLYLLHGIWANEDNMVESANVYTKLNTEDFSDEIKRTIDLIHGNATLEERPGHASGIYHSDISEYVLGWIIGTEWDPIVVDSTNSINYGEPQYEGAYFRTANASPFEIWLARIMDDAVSYEEEHYGWQRPMSFTNWVTTDPLEHPAEPLAQEDMVSVNPESIQPTSDLVAGYFATYHVYPYYPDFMNYETKYVEYIDFRGERNNYAGYLNDLKQAHSMPVLVAEFGVPASRGLTHRNVSGWNQGFHSETEQGHIDARLIEDILYEGMAGGLVFTWQDEWFKRTWNTMDYDDPDRRPLWSNIQTNEQHFGLLSFDPGLEQVIIHVDGDPADWERANIPPLLSGLEASDQGTDQRNSGAKRLYVTSDERYVYVRLDFEQGFLTDGMMSYATLYINTIDEQGQHTIPNPGGDGLTSDIGFDFAIELKGQEQSRILVDSYYDPFYYQYGELLGLIPQLSYAKLLNNGVYHPIRLALNKELKLPDREGADAIIPFEAYETGMLKYGNANPEYPQYNSLTDIAVSEDKSMLELRIPWQLLNVKDPSSRQIISNMWEHGLEGSEETAGLRMAVVSYQLGKLEAGAEEGNAQVVQTLPATTNGSLLASEIPLYTWDKWELPQYHERLKESYHILQQSYKTLELEREPSND